MIDNAALWIDNGTGPIRNPALSDTEFDKGLAARVASNISSLWQAAHDFEHREISGSAVGLIVLGVTQGRPKCVQAQAWIRSIWALYYQRKATITEHLNPEDLDFSSVGPCPWTVPDLMSEIGMEVMH